MHLLPSPASQEIWRTVGRGIRGSIQADRRHSKEGMETQIPSIGMRRIGFFAKVPGWRLQSFFRPSTFAGLPCSRHSPRQAVAKVCLREKAKTPLRSRGTLRPDTGKPVQSVLSDYESLTSSFRDCHVTTRFLLWCSIDVNGLECESNKEIVACLYQKSIRKLPGC